MNRISKANVIPKRQPDQYSCTTTSLSMALQALGIPDTECSTSQVNAVLGAMPLRGAGWEQVSGAASHYGCRSTLVVPATLAMVRAWTDAGTPVLIGWNTGNEWSHASLIFDVTDTQVFVADPNIPNPTQTVRILTHDEFYEKWWEKSTEGYKIRRPAMAIEREITPEGRQVRASLKGGLDPRVVERAVSLLAYQDEGAVAKQLMKDNGLDSGEAFQAVKAAKILYKDRETRMNRRGTSELEILWGPTLRGVE